MEKSELKTKPFAEDRPLAFLFLLSALEFLWVSYRTLLIETDPKNSFLLGFSLPRLGIFLLATTFVIGFAWLSRLLWLGRFQHLRLVFLRKYCVSLTPILFGLFLTGLLLLLIPGTAFGRFESYFERVRALVSVISLVPFQISLRWGFKKIERPNKTYFSSVLIALGLMFALWLFIFVTRVGISPDIYFWNVAGMPVTTAQLLLIVLIAFLISQILSVSWLRNFFKDEFVTDGALVIFLFILGAYFWGHTPMLKHFNSLRPTPPYFEPYPYFDSELYDTGSLSILMGYGINFGNYIDKPLYLVFLAFLHRIAAFDYIWLTELHAYAMAITIPVAFLFGRAFYNRYFGIMLALLILVQQSNAITFSHVIASVNPRLLLTEVPMLLGIMAFSWLVFLWFSRRSTRPWFAFLAGGILGALSLIRLNSFGFLPALMLLAYFVFRKSKQGWFKQALAFFLGFCLLLGPWIVTGRNSSGESYFLRKFKDVIESRYYVQNLQPEQPGNRSVATRARKGWTTAINYSGENNEILIETQEFPGFIANHFLHNVITSFLALPDSISTPAQDINELSSRPYWDEAQVTKWDGNLPISQLVFLFINIIFISIGLVFSWRQWQWAGITPLLIFLIYNATLGFARVSGSRYIVPINWIVFFYYGIGIVSLLEHLPIRAHLISSENDNTGTFAHHLSLKLRRRFAPVAVAFLILLTTLIPIAQLPSMLDFSKNCESAYSLSPSLLNEFPDEMRFMKGMVLYPRVQKNQTSFTFLSCGLRVPVVLKGVDIILDDNQKVVMGYYDNQLKQPEIFFFLDDSMDTIWSKE